MQAAADEKLIEQIEVETGVSLDEAVFQMILDAYYKMYQGSKEATVQHMTQQAQPHEVEQIMQCAVQIPDHLIAPPSMA